MIINNTTKLTNPTGGILRTLAFAMLAALTLPFATLTFAENAKNTEKAILQERNLKEIVVPKIQLKDMPFSLAIEFLVHRSKELDRIATDPAKKGINVAMIGDFEKVLLTLDVKSIPLGEALEFMTQLADGKIEKKSNVIIIRAKGTPGINDLENSSESSAETNRKLDEIVIPHLEFHDTPLAAALAFIHSRSEKLDSKSPKEKKGVNIVLKAGKPDKKPRVTLRLSDQTLRDALSLTAQSAGLQMQVKGSYVLITRPEEK